MTAVTASPGSGAEALVADALRAQSAGAVTGADDLLARARRWGPDLEAGVRAVFDGPMADALLDRLAAIAVSGWLVRPQPLRERDRDRLLRPTGSGARRPGYVATPTASPSILTASRSVDYLRSRYDLPAPHAAALAAGRDSYAVPTTAGAATWFDGLPEARDRPARGGIALTIDLVLNHVAREHRC
jgi:hypothetical protein